MLHVILYNGVRSQLTFWRPLVNLVTLRVNIGPQLQYREWTSVALALHVIKLTITDKTYREKNIMYVFYLIMYDLRM